MRTGTFTGFKLVVGKAIDSKMSTRTTGCLERIMLQGNCAALSLPGPKHSPPNMCSRHEEKAFIM